MKRYLIFIFLFFFFQKIHATHNFGGEIILNQIGDKQYEAKLITYTRFVPSNPSSGVESLILCWGDGFCEPVSRDTFYELDCALKQTIYKSNHTYEEEGTYTLASSDLNRGSGILNINPPTSHNVPFHVQTKITVTNSWNRFPIFMNPPTDVGQVNTVFQHNPAVIDLDGDSLSFSLIVPMEGLNQSIWTYIFPNEILPGPNNNLTIDEERGTITWDAPQLAGYYSMAILIKEHRNGIILSETIRDFRVTIAPIGTIPNLSPVINIDVDEVTLSVGDEFNFEVICDELEGEQIMVQSFGLSHLWVNPSQFSLLPNFFPPVVTGNFSWTITDEHQSLEPYYVVFRTEEDELGQGNNCGKTSYQVLKININEPITSIDTKENFEFKIFPNPLVHQQLQLEIPTEFISKQCSYKIINLHGQVLKEGNLKPGKHIQTIDIQQFSGGVYSFILQSNNKMGVQKFVKLK